MSNTISNKALKLKLNPNSSQYYLFLKFFGCERFIYNFYLNEKNQFYEKEIKPLGTDKKARNAVWKTFEETPLADLKKQYPFLKEADSQGIANAYKNRVRRLVKGADRYRNLTYLFGGLTVSEEPM